MDEEQRRGGLKTFLLGGLVGASAALAAIGRPRRGQQRRGRPPRPPPVGSAPGHPEPFPPVPIYEYRCPNGHTFEVFQRMTDPPSETCVTCGAGPVEKLLFPIAVHFKGSGFYSPDYGRGTKG